MKTRIVPKQSVFKALIGRAISLAGLVILLVIQQQSEARPDKGVVKTARTERSKVGFGASPYVWKQARIGPLGFIPGMVISPLPPYHKYVRTDVGGLYSWIAATQSWEPATDRLMRDDVRFTQGIESVTVDPMKAEGVYIAAGDIYHSDDAGKTWTPLNLRKPDGSPIYMGPNDDWRQAGERLQLDPNGVGNAIYFGSRKDGLWRSLDRGISWNAVTSFPSAGEPGQGISFVVFDPRSGDKRTPSRTFYVGVLGGGIFLTKDGGATWLPAVNQPDNAYRPLKAAIDAKSGVLYVTYSKSHAWAGADGGAIFRYVEGTGTDITPRGYHYAYCGISIDPTDTRRIVTAPWPWANNQNEAVLTSTDAGANWSAGPAQFHQPSWWTSYTPQNWNACLIIDPEKPVRTWMGNGCALFATQDNRALPQQWVTAGDGIEELVGQHLRKIPGASEPLLFASMDRTGFTLTDLTQATETKWEPGEFGYGESLDFCAAHPNFVVRSASGQRDKIGRSGYSEDGGRTWVAFASWPAGEAKYGIIAMSGAVPDNLVLLALGKNGHAYYTHDRGKSWNLSRTEEFHASWLKGVYAVTRPIVSDLRGNFYCCSIEQGGFWKSTDGGETWAKVSKNVLPWNWRCVLKATPGASGDLWLAFSAVDKEPGSLWHSVDGGSNWTKTAGLAQVNAIGFGKAAPGSSVSTVYLSGAMADAAGTLRRGIYRSMNLLSMSGDGAAAHWEKIDDGPFAVPSSATTWDGVEGDPDVFGKVYVSVGGRGLFYGVAAGDIAK